MANLIRLKQIESGSQLSTAASVGEDFSSSVFEIIDGAGLVSSSAQIVLSQTTGSLTSSRLVGDILASAIEYSNILSKPTLVSGSSQIISILNPLNQHSASINEFTSSLDTIFATDAELAISQSNISIDMGEF